MTSSEERAGAAFGRGDEKQRGTERVPLLPRLGSRVVRVASRLVRQAAVGHRSHVQLDKSSEAPVLTFDLDETEAFVRELFDFSCLHVHWDRLVIINAVAVVVGRSLKTDQP